MQNWHCKPVQNSHMSNSILGRNVTLVPLQKRNYFFQLDFATIFSLQVLFTTNFQMQTRFFNCVRWLQMIVFHLELTPLIRIEPICHAFVKVYAWMPPPINLPNFLESSRDPTCQFGDCRFWVTINKKMLQSARKHEVQSKLQDITQVEASQHLDSSIPIDLNWTTLTFAFISIHVQMISTILAFKHFHKVWIAKNLVPRKNWLRQQNISGGNERTTIINTQLTNSIGKGLISIISVVQFFDLINNLWFWF